MSRDPRAMSTFLSEAELQPIGFPKTMNASTDNPQTGQGRPLPKKEGDLFRSVVKHYETKQYKKGIKASDNILKKFPKHGETLCMKGLTLHCMGKKDDAVALIKMGLMNDMR